MSNILYNLSGKIKDPDHIQALYAIKKVADSLNIAFFIVGASARDYILEHCYNLKCPRGTTDIDLGVEVGNWDQFRQLTESLVATGQFSFTKENQRLIFKSALIDIVPFGGITDAYKKICWPPEQEFVMSMLGFQEAYDYSITVRLSSSPELDVKLPSLPGLAIMKIISWKDNYPHREKDAEDLTFIMQNYYAAGNFDRLYDNEQSLLQEEAYDTKLAGVRLLGRDMAKIADRKTTETIKNILLEETQEDSRFRLIPDMNKHRYMSDGTFEELLKQLSKLKEGFFEHLYGSLP